MASFEIYKAKNGEFRWRMRAPNGEIICVSEGYKQKASAKKGIDSVMKNAGKATVKDLSAAAKTAKTAKSAKA